MFIGHKQYDLIYALMFSLDRLDKKLKSNSIPSLVGKMNSVGDLQSHTYQNADGVYSAFTAALIAETLLTNFTGLTGPVNFDVNQDRVASVIMWQLQDDPSAATQPALKKVWVGQYYGVGSTVPGEALVGELDFHPELCHYGTPNDKPPNIKPDIVGPIVGGVVGGVVLIASVIGFIIFMHRRAQANKELMMNNWLVPWSAVQTGKRTSGEHGGSQRQTQQSMRSTQASESRSLTSASRGTMQSKNSAGTKHSNSMGTLSQELYDKHFAVVYDLEKVWLKEFEHPLKVTAHSPPHVLNAYFPTARVLNRIGNDNLAKFIGITMPSRDESSFCYVMFRFMPKNSLSHLLGNDAVELSDDFKSSIIRDLIHGVLQLASTPLGSHGFLHSQNVVVDSRFTAFITDYGVSFAHEENEFIALTVQMVHNLEDGFVQKMFYRAPELLRAGLPPHGTKKGDVYSLGIIMAQITT